MVVHIWHLGSDRPRVKEFPNFSTLLCFLTTITTTTNSPHNACTSLFFPHRCLVITVVCSVNPAVVLPLPPAQPRPRPAAHLLQPPPPAITLPLAPQRPQRRRRTPQQPSPRALACSRRWPPLQAPSQSARPSDTVSRACSSVAAALHPLRPPPSSSSSSNQTVLLVKYRPRVRRIHLSTSQRNKHTDLDD